jgi:predicted metalloprotease with PDZ domain
MIHYTFSAQNPAQQYIVITTQFDTNQTSEIIQLASWRPGRYELGNFAKNVKGLKVFNENGKLLVANKINKDTWKIETENAKRITVEYQFYAPDLNAGSTYLSKDQLYVNPVNCCLWVHGKETQPCEIDLKIPAQYNIATSLKQKGQKLFAANYDELADSPWIASANLQHGEYFINDVKFNICFQGEIKIDWERIKKDFTAFTDKQIEKFTEFPVEEYHFLFQIVPYKAYHGVEHERSTVILLGPSYDVFDAIYKELLGVSSHELYHTWNVKAIRPIEMFPYDFSKENYSQLGYLCEGVTTYMGDLFLFKSGVFTFEQYALELNNQLQKHFDNFGRFQYSVAQSSFDTWLDGYVPGAPNRKVSIYTEGCLIAFATDAFIAKNSNEKYKLDDAMKALYFDFFLQGKGVSEDDYKQTVERFAGAKMDKIYTNFIHGTAPFESMLTETFEYLGLEMKHKPSTKYSFAKLGFKSIPQGSNFIVKSIYPESPADASGMMLEDEIIAINSYNCGGELDKWLNYFEMDKKIISVSRKGQLIELSLSEMNRNFYLEYNVSQIENPTIQQKKAFEFWMK